MLLKKENKDKVINCETNAQPVNLFVSFYLTWTTLISI